MLYRNKKPPKFISGLAYKGNRCAQVALQQSLILMAASIVYPNQNAAILRPILRHGKHNTMLHGAVKSWSIWLR